MNIQDLFKRKQVWEYGACRGIVARRGRCGNVQFVLWKAGQQGHIEDYWHDFDSSWWSLFVPDMK